MITIQVDDKQVLDMLTELSRRMANLQPAMKEIGEDIVESTKRRFASATGPDGAAWEPNSQVTLDRFIGLHTKNYKTEDGSLLPNKNFKKDGSLSKRGQSRVAAGAAKKPLTGKTKTLQSTINYQLNGTSAVHIGSPKVYAAMQQFGGTTSPRSMIPGKTIPARPFLGVSALDKANILDILGSYLSK
jgi:phage gpG-like protein